MADAKVDLEKADSRPPSASSPSTDAFNEKDHDPEETGFEPIRTRNTAARPGSRAGSVSRTLSRTRSQNGYSCDDYPGDNTDEDASPGAQTPEDKDPFEVGFDGGNADPLCPRSMATARKWLIVSIVSSASFCV